MSLVEHLNFYLWRYIGDLRGPILNWWREENVKILLGKASQLGVYSTLWFSRKIDPLMVSLKNLQILPIVDKTLLRRLCLVADRTVDSRFIRCICDRRGQPFCLQEDSNFLRHKVFLSRRLKKHDDFYYIPEFGPVAEKCSQSTDGFHVYDQSMILEIVDKLGGRADGGTMGRVVITYFLNHYMPFVRYDTGERGLYLKRRCSCGKKIFVPEPQERFSLDINGRSFGRQHFDRLFSFYHLLISRYEILGYDGGTLKIAIEPGIFWRNSLLDDLKKEIAKLIGSLTGSNGVFVDLVLGTTIKTT